MCTYLCYHCFTRNFDIMMESFSLSKINFQPGNDFLYNEWSLLPEVSMWDSASVLRHEAVENYFRWPSWLQLPLAIMLGAGYWLKICKISNKIFLGIACLSTSNLMFFLTLYFLYSTKKVRENAGSLFLKDKLIFSFHTNTAI